MTLKGLWPVEEPTPEQQVRNEEKQKEMNRHALNPVSRAAIALLKGPSVAHVEGPGDHEAGRRGVRRGAEGCFSKCFFVCFYFSIPE